MVGFKKKKRKRKNIISFHKIDYVYLELREAGTFYCLIGINTLPGKYFSW